MTESQESDPIRSESVQLVALERTLASDDIALYFPDLVAAALAVVLDCERGSFQH